jgi:hypothetical protein
VDTAPVVASGGWAAAVLAGLATWSGSTVLVNLVLHHLRLASGSKPAVSWLARVAAIAEDRDARRLLR